MSEDSQVVGVRFPEERVDEIDERAEAEDKSRSDWIRDVVKRALGEEMLEDRVEILEEILQEQFQIDVDEWEGL